MIHGNATLRRWAFNAAVVIGTSTLLTMCLNAF